MKKVSKKELKKFSILMIQVIALVSLISHRILNKHLTYAADFLENPFFWITIVIIIMITLIYGD